MRKRWSQPRSNRLLRIFEMKHVLVPLLAVGMLTAAHTAPAMQDDEGEEVTSTETGETESDDLEAKLEEARERLEDAAHEVAELSAEIGRPVMDRFMAFGEGPRRAIIGVQLDPASGKDGARVKDVSPGGPAAEAGMQAKDVIVMVNGTPVKGDSAREVARLVRKVEPDSKVNVRVLRDGKPRDFVVIARPSVFAFTAPLGALAPVAPLPPLPPHAPGRDGEDVTFEAPFFHEFGGDFADMELAALTPSLGRYFGTNEGVLVVRAPKEDGLKLEDGDVILSIDGRKPTSGSHATRILRSYQPGETVDIKVMRQKKAMSLDVTLPQANKAFRAKRVFRTEEPT
jgi:predicted metalloprotease with PDZ domain